MVMLEEGFEEQTVLHRLVTHLAVFQLAMCLGNSILCVGKMAVGDEVSE